MFWIRLRLSQLWLKAVWFMSSCLLACLEWLCFKQLTHLFWFVFGQSLVSWWPAHNPQALLVALQLAAMWPYAQHRKQRRRSMYSLKRYERQAIDIDLLEDIILNNLGLTSNTHVFPLEPNDCVNWLAFRLNLNLHFKWWSMSSLLSSRNDLISLLLSTIPSIMLVSSISVLTLNIAILGHFSFGFCAWYKLVDLFIASKIFFWSSSEVQSIIMQLLC
jgi:hypothetical protein